MFGYVTLYRKGLADAEMDRYQAYYCGLCRTLGRRYGHTGQLALSYDMAFVAILLTALYDTPTAFSEGRCVPHPLKKRPRADNELPPAAYEQRCHELLTQQMGRCGGFILAGGGQADISAQIIPVFDQGNQINVHVFSQDIG